MRKVGVTWSVLVVGALVVGESSAHAQAPGAPPAPGSAPAPGAVAPPRLAAPASPTTTQVAPQGAPTSPLVVNLPEPPPTSTALSPVPVELLETTPGGLTAEQAGRRAAQTSPTARAANEQYKAAGARTDAAAAAFIPRLSGVARYTRLSNFTPPNLGGGGYIVATPSSYTDPVTKQPVNVPPGQLQPGAPLAAVNFAFPLVLDNWLLQGTLTVPITDYFLRINEGYTAASKSEEAARWDAISARATSLSNGEVNYYDWQRARGQYLIAVQQLNDARTHLADARNQFTVGNASRADVLRQETAVARADLQLTQAGNILKLAEQQLRVAMHAPPEEKIVAGEGFAAPVAPLQGDVAKFIEEAKANRVELKSLDANIVATRRLVRVQRASRYPQVGAFADAIYANPNPRRFPAADEWFPTWDVGVQATWSPTDILTANANGADYEARANALEGQKDATRDGITLEVTQAVQAVQAADVALETTQRQLYSAQEAYRVARELFNNGRGTSTTLSDAETELTNARLTFLYARIDARTTRVQLDHALGRDTKLVQP